MLVKNALHGGLHGPIVGLDSTAVDHCLVAVQIHFMVVMMLVATAARAVFMMMFLLSHSVVFILIWGLIFHSQDDGGHRVPFFS